MYYEGNCSGCSARRELKNVVEFVNVLNQAGSYFSSQDISPVLIDLLEES